MWILRQGCPFLLCLAASVDASPDCQEGADSQSLLQTLRRTARADAPDVLSWDGPTLLRVQNLLSDPLVSPPAWVAKPLESLMWQANKLRNLPSGWRRDTPAGPWSPTQKKLTPPSGDKRDYMTVSGYSWPCFTTCNETLFGAEKCKLWFSGERAFGPCDENTGKPWVIHDGFMNYDNLQDLDLMIVAMDTLETLTLAWWFSPKQAADRGSYASAAVSVFRAYFLNETTRLNPRFLYGGGVPGKYNGTAGSLIAPSFRMNSRVTDCATLLQGSDVWSEEDTRQWLDWVGKWSHWLQTSEFGKIEMSAVGNHATFWYIHNLALDRVTGNRDHASKIIRQIRTDLAGSLASQIRPSGEMPIETARVTGAIYSMMNIEGLFLLGTVVSNLCKAGFACDEAWDWNWKSPPATAASWQKFSNNIAKCRYKGRDNSATSAEACKISCASHGKCNMAVTRTKYGRLYGCYFQQCKGTDYRLRKSAPGDVKKPWLNIFDSYARVESKPEGSGSLRKAVDYLLPYARGDKIWTDDHQGTSKDNSRDRWAPFAAVLRRAAVVYGEEAYEHSVEILKKDFKTHRFNLLYPQFQD